MTTLERIEKIEKDLKTITDNLAQFQDLLAPQLGSINQLSNLANSRSLSLEVSLTELAKMVTSVASELQDAKVLDTKKVMDRIIKMNQDEDAKEIESLTSQGILLHSQEVKPHSFVVCSHTIVDLAKPEDSKVVMERRVLRLPTPLVGEQLRADLIGRKVEDQVQINKEQDGKVHILTVKEIYDLNESELVRQGENALNGPQN